MPFLALFGITSSMLANNAKNVAFALAKLALFIAYVALGIGILFVASYNLLDGISTQVPATAQMVWGWFMPPNAFGCLTTILTIRILRAGYDFKVQLAKLKVQSITT